MNARPYKPDDLATVQAWAVARGMVIAENLIPPDAYMVEDETGPAAFAVLYFRTFCPVCSLDHFTTRPGMTGRQSLEAWKELESAAFARVMALRESGEADYRVFETFADERLAVHAESIGYIVGSKPHVHIAKLIP